MRTTALAFTFVLCLVSIASAGWEEDLDRVLAMEPGEERDALAAAVAAAEPDWKAISDRIAARPRTEKSTGTLLRKRMCTDDVERPWVLYVPEGYDPAKPTPLLVSLHGLVTRPEVIPDQLEYAGRIVYRSMAEERGWLLAIPFGQQGATWFDEVGMANIRDIVREVKRERNVDDDRVWMGGFSDGASGAFFYAMVRPNDYGAFLALNGHMGVGSQFAKVDTFAPNFANSATYVMTSDADPLYATKKMRPGIEMAIAAGGRILYRQFKGAHDWRHVQPELENLADYLERNPRDPFPGQVVWETGDPEDFGLCRWFGIDAISSAPREPWHGDHNALVAEDRVSIGFFNDEYEGDGMKVKSVVPESFAKKVGLAAGDIVVGMNDTTVKAMPDLNEAKAKVSRGDKVSLIVMREGEKLTLTGNLPPIDHYWIFQRHRRSALAKAIFSANKVYVEGSRVGAVRIMVHPDMVNLDEKLVVSVDGKTLFEDYVEPDPAFLIRNYLANRDRKLMYVAEVKVDVPVK